MSEDHECKWVATNCDKDGKPDFRIHSQMSPDPLMNAACSECGARTWFTGEQWVMVSDGVKEVAITIDSWKYQIFKRILKRNKFEFEKVQGELFWILKIKTDKMVELKAVVEICQLECAKIKQN